MNASQVPVALFRLGGIVATPEVLAHLSSPDILGAIQRHQAGDWGDVNEHDREANDRALSEGARLISVHHSAKGVKFQLITEADRSVTTVLLPGDY